MENLDHPLHKEVKNKDSKTASQVFMEEHRPLVKEAKNWIKDRSDSCMLVATLIATITFAAAITVPGGNNQDKGTPIFLPNNKFSVFIWSDAVAFFSSMTSLVVFIRNMTGYYTEEEFVRVLHTRFKFFTIGICLLAALPFILCVILLLPSSALLVTLRLIIPEKDLLVWN
jgi:hypothetical protein